MTITGTSTTRYMRDRKKAARITAPLRPFAGRAPDATPDEEQALRRALLERDEPSAELVRAIRQDRTVTLAQFRTALAEGIDAVPDAPDPAALEARVAKHAHHGLRARKPSLSREGRQRGGLSGLGHGTRCYWILPGSIWPSFMEGGS